MFKNKILFLIMIICLVFLFVSPCIGANNFPNKPITVIVPFSPGGGTDTVLRPIIAVAEEYLGQPLVPVYKPGAHGVTAAVELSQAEPDGYTLIMISGTNILVNPHIENMPYTFDDFKAIAQMSEEPLYLAVRTDSPWKTVEELISSSKESDVSFKIGNSGVFSPQHFVAELLKLDYEANIEPIPFEGGAQSLAALLGGHIDVAIDYKTMFLPHIEEGSLRFLACSSSADHRDPATPNTPTLKEEGYNIEIAGWKGFHAPNGISPERVAFLEEAFRKISEDANYIDLANQANVTMEYKNSENFQKYLEELNQKYFQILEKTGYIGD